MSIRRLVFLLVTPLSVAAQQPVVEQLKPENGRIDSAYQTFVVRELRDGRLLLPVRGKLMVADFATRRAEPPQDVPAGELIALAGDSTLVATQGTGWIFLEGTRVLGMLPSSNPVVASMQWPIGIDGAGHVVGVVQARSASDSDQIVRVARTSGAVEVIGHLWAPGLPAGVPAPVFMVFERAVAAPDGWIAAIRSHPYRVDWRSPAGEWTRGAPIDTAPTPMNRREQDAYVARPVWSPPNGTLDWPQFVEPFTSPEPLITPEGTVVVRRTPTADLPGVRYDVIDRHGILLRTVHVRDGTSDVIAGFGQHSVYVWAADSKHGALGHLGRHPWP